MSVLTELLPLSLAMAGKGLTGIYNFTNPGVISHNEVLALYQAEVDPDFAWENFSVQEQASILAAGRSNNCLDTTKLEAAAAALGMPLPDIHSATRAALRAARKHLEVPAPPAAPARSPPRRADAAAPRPRETTPRGCQRSSAPATARCRQHSRGAPSAMHGVAARGACGEVRAAAGACARTKICAAVRSRDRRRRAATAARPRPALRGRSRGEAARRRASRGAACRVSRSAPRAPCAARGAPPPAPARPPRRPLQPRLRRRRRRRPPPTPASSPAAR